MKIIVTGGRDYKDKEKVFSTLKELNPEIIIHGDCAGADLLAKEWAVLNKKTQIPYPYPSKYGKAGGPIRNKQMCTEHPDATLVAFPGGRGTANCKQEATKLGIKIIEVI